MRHLPLFNAWITLAVYVAGGLALGVADSLLGRVAQQAGLRPGVATAVSVNALMPLLAVTLAVLCPLVRTAWGGAVGMTLALIAGLACAHPLPAWDPGTLLRAIHPVLAVAWLGYGILGTIAALATRAVRA